MTSTPTVSTAVSSVTVRRGRPLTAAQRALWVSQQQNPTAPVQNMAEVVHLRGAVDPERLAQAFARVVAASDALRTRVVTDHGEPRAVIYPQTGQAPSQLLTMDRSEVESWLRARVTHPIDPGVRAYDSVIISHPGGTTTWYLGLHHLVTDATSSALVFEAAARAYVDDTTPLELPSYYRWNDERPGGRRADRARRHWQQRTPPSVPGRLYAGERPAGPSSQRVEVPLSDTVRAQIDDRLADDLRLLSPDLSWTVLLVTMCAVWAHRVADLDELAIGIPVHHRNEPGARAVIGPVMDVYPVDIRIEAGESFRDLHRRVARSVMSTLQHVGPAGPPSSPDHRFIVNLLPETSPESFGVIPAEVEWIHSGASDPTHLARIQLTRFGQQPRLHLDLNEAAAEPAHHHRAVGHLASILEALVTDPDTSIGDLVLPDGEEREALERWGVGSPAIDAELVVERLRSLSERPDPCLFDGSETWSGARLWSESLRVATWLRRRGVGPGHRVGLDLDRSADTVAAIFGTLAAGASFVPLDPEHPEDRKRRLIERAGCSIVLRERPSDLPDDVEPPTPVSGDDEAYLLFTSGSTGEPKGVPISHRGLADYVAFAAAAYPTPHVPPVGALFSALTFDLTLTSVFVPLLSGGQLIVIQPGGTTGLRRVADDGRITWLKATPSHLELLLRLANDTGLSLQTLVVGGEAFTSHLLDRLHRRFPDAEIFNEYGPTEAVVGCMIHRAEGGQSRERTEIPIGRPAPGVHLMVLDRYDRPAPIGAVGELHIAHRGLTAGYLDDDRTVDERQPFTILEGRRYYRSGDLVRLLDDHTLVYLGRADEQLKVGGIRLDPAEVEQALVAHPAIRRAVVRSWHPSPTRPRRFCVRCSLPDNVPGAIFDEAGVCATCHAYERIRPRAEAWFRQPADLVALRDEARSRRSGPYDAIHLLSGGKDSTYAMYQLAEMGFEVLALTLDNGFISEEAKANIRRSVADLGIDHDFLTTEVMNDIFRDSLERHSNVCHGCYKTIYTLATTRAVEVGAPLIITGLSRGQLFETRLVPEQFDAKRFDPEAIDAATLQARRVYHRLDDGPNRLLDTSVFHSDEDVFERVQYVDFFRYVDVELAEMLDFLSTRAPWIRPSDTGRSTNCLINAAGIHTHVNEQGFHNYAVPYAWDVRLGHKTRQEALDELDDELDLVEVTGMLEEVGYRPRPRQILTAWIESTDHDGADRRATLDPSALRTFLAASLPAHALPAAFVEVEEIPLSTNGKVDAARLPAPRRVHRSGPSLYVAAQSPREQEIVALWERLLGIEPIGVDDDFFALGGDSLLALRMVIEFSGMIGANLREEFAFTHPTPRLLAEATATGATPLGVPDRPVARPEGEPPPFSAAEQGLRFEHGIAPEDPRDNVGRRYVVEGPVDPGRLADALRSVMAAHVPLRWTFGEPRRKLDPADALDLTLSSEPITSDAFAHAARRLHLTPFDLDNGPLGRALVQPLVGGATGIALVFHHVSVDAGTFDVLWEQVDRRYQGNELPSLPLGADGSPLDHADVTQWQQSRLGPNDAAFWSSDELARVPAELDLAPLGAPGPGSPDGYVERALSLTRPQLVAGGFTPFATALTALAVALRPLADGDDLAIAVSASTRELPLAEDLVGYYLNTLPLIVEARPERPLGELAADVGRSMGTALGHRAYPFSRIVADRRAAGAPPPSTSIMLAFEDLAPARLGPLPASHEVLATGSAVTDATFFVQTRGSRVSLGLEFRGTVLDEERALDLLQRFDEALTRVLEQPSAPVIPPVSGDGIPAFHGPRTSPRPEHHLEELVEAWAQKRPAAAPLVAPGLQLTYAEVERAANLVARELVGRGVGPGHFVGLEAQREPLSVVGALAVLKAGAAYVPLDPELPPVRRDRIVQDAGLRLVLGPRSSDGTLTVTVADILGHHAHDPDPGPPPIERRRHDPAYVLFTSGSTGTPKGVVVTHGNIIESTSARSVAYPGPVERFLLLSSLAFDSSLVGQFWTLTTGGTLVFPASGQHTELHHLTELIEEFEITHLLALPSLYRLLLEESGNLSSLRVAIVAGEACPLELVDLHRRSCPDAGLWNEYGPTEGTVWSHLFPVVSLPEGAATVPIGRPIANTVAHVLDQFGRPVGVGESGELYLGGRGLSRGYLGRPDLTSAAFVRLPNPLDDGELHYRTGDRVRILSTGDLEFLGRLDDQVKIRGHRVELGEVEAVARAVAGVTEAVAVAVEGPRGQRLEMWYTGTESEAALRSALMERLPSAAVPSRVWPVDDLPRTPTGKVDRLVLRALAPASADPTSAADPGAGLIAADDVAEELVDLVAGLWHDVLGVDLPAPHDDFFSLGGDSIMSMQIASRLRRLGWQLPTRAVFDHPTVVGMAAQLRPIDVGAGEPERPTGDFALSGWDAEDLDQLDQILGELDV